MFFQGEDDESGIEDDDTDGEEHEDMPRPNADKQMPSRKKFKQVMQDQKDENERFLSWALV